MFDLITARSRARVAPAGAATSGAGPTSVPPARLPPSVARMAERTRLSSELLAALIAVDGRSRVTLDDMERADALADVLLARRRQRAGVHPVRPFPRPPAGARR